MCLPRLNGERVMWLGLGMNMPLIVKGFAIAIIMGHTSDILNLLGPSYQAKDISPLYLLCIFGIISGALITVMPLLGVYSFARLSKRWLITFAAFMPALIASESKLTYDLFVIPGSQQNSNQTLRNHTSNSEDCPIKDCEAYLYGPRNIFYITAWIVLLAVAGQFLNFLLALLVISKLVRPEVAFSRMINQNGIMDPILDVEPEAGPAEPEAPSTEKQSTEFESTCSRLTEKSPLLDGPVPGGQSLYGTSAPNLYASAMDPSYRASTRGSSAPTSRSTTPLPSSETPGILDQKSDTAQSTEEDTSKADDPQAPKEQSEKSGSAQASREGSPESGSAQASSEGSQKSGSAQASREGSPKSGSVQISREGSPKSGSVQASREESPKSGSVQASREDSPKSGSDQDSREGSPKSGSVQAPKEGSPKSSSAQASEEESSKTKEQEE